MGKTINPTNYITSEHIWDQVAHKTKKKHIRDPYKPNAVYSKLDGVTSKN